MDELNFPTRDDPRNCVCRGTSRELKASTDVVVDGERAAAAKHQNLITDAILYLLSDRGNKI